MTSNRERLKSLFLLGIVTIVTTAGVLYLTLGNINVGQFNEPSEETYQEIEDVTSQLTNEDIVNLINETDFDKYRIKSVEVVDGRVILNYNYNVEAVEVLMEDMGETEFIEYLENWTYSDNKEWNTPYHTMEGKSNCQGVTLFILDWLLANRPIGHYPYSLEVITKTEEINDAEQEGITVPTSQAVEHQYLQIKPDNGSLEVVDLTRDKTQGIKTLKKALQTYISE